jgi:hypothetical protein
LKGSEECRWIWGKKTYLKCKENKTQEEYIIYKLIRNEVNSRIRKLKEDYCEIYNNKLQRDFYDTQK